MIESAARTDPLGGLWVVRSGVISTLDEALISVAIITALLVTTHEPPSSPIWVEGCR